MRVKLFKNVNLEEDYIDIHYREINRQIDKIVKIAGNQQPYIVVKKSDTEYKVEYQDIFYYETVDKKYFLYTKNDVYETNVSLKDIEVAMKPYGFARINKSMIVNVYKVQKLRADVNMRILVYLVNGESVMVTRHYRKGFYKMIKAESNNRGYSHDSKE